MDSDSPLSPIDFDGVVADSEDEGHQIRAKEGKSVDRDLSHDFSLGQTEYVPPYSAMTGQIDYFAGFQENMLPIPSIAERAKTRQRKSRTRTPIDSLELTDEDESILKPENSKPTKRTKPKGKKRRNSSVAFLPDQVTDQKASTIPQTIDHTDLWMANAKPRVRPRPIKKPAQSLSSLHRTFQATIPVPTSPSRSPRQYPLDNPLLVGLPSSDPPPTSSMVPDKEAQLPPIEVLRPIPMDSDTPLPSSLAGENIDELQGSTTHDQLARDNRVSLLLPPPTFFAGSSSLPSAQASAAPTPKSPLPPSSIIDLTDIPTTLVEASTSAGVDAGSSTKDKKPRKPRKKKRETEDASLPTGDLQATKRQKKGKGKIPHVTVEVLLPLPAEDLADAYPTSAPRRKWKQRKMYDNTVQEAEEDELNIGANHDNAIVGSAAGPSSWSPRNGNKPEDINRIVDSGEHDSSTEKRKGRKRTKNSEPGRPVHTTASRDTKRKTVDSAEEHRGGAEEDPPATTKPSKKQKKGNDKCGNDVSVENPQTTRPTPSRRRMVVTSDDDEPTAKEPTPSPKPQETQKRQNKIQAEAARDDASNRAKANEGSSQDDRDTLKVQPIIQNGFGEEVTQRQQTPFAGKYTRLSSRYTIAPNTQTSGMSELLRRVSSQPMSPFSTTTGRNSPIPGLAYSPYLKSSRRALSRIAPLHPNRKTPPPPLPPPPPKKKSKKELEREEKWEEEIIEDIGGISEWLALSESEKRDLRRVKRDREMGYCED